MEWGSKLHPGNVFIFCLLSRNDISQEVGPGEEPMTTEDVEDVEDRKVDDLRKRPPRSTPPPFTAGRSGHWKDVEGPRTRGLPAWEQGKGNSQGLD